MQENKSCCFFVHNVQLTEYCSSYVNHPRSDSLERSVFQKCRFVFVCLFVCQAITLEPFEISSLNFTEAKYGQKLGRIRK